MHGRVGHPFEAFEGLAEPAHGFIRSQPAQGVVACSLGVFDRLRIALRSASPLKSNFGEPVARLRKALAFKGLGHPTVNPLPPAERHRVVDGSLGESMREGEPVIGTGDRYQQRGLARFLEQLGQFGFIDFLDGSQ